MALHIHTSDRNLFKRCRRKWNYSSPLRMNMGTPKGEFISYFWVGTGFHFALEDYHGYNKFGDPAKAFQAYCDCFDKKQLGMNIEALITIVPGMLNHYVNDWLPKRRKFETYWVDGKPQVEVKVLFELKKLSKLVGEPVYYSMRFDRVVTDEYDRLWIMDYKTVGNFNTNKLETDLQISAYSWGGEIFYNKPIEGMIYLQLKKELIGDPRILKNGDISVDKSQNTNYYRYLEALNFKYGCLNDATEKHKETLDHLRQQEDEYGDKYIRYDLVRRNKATKHKQYDHIIAEGKEMLNKDLPIYPNPTYDCYRDCPYRSVCLAEEEDQDWQFILNSNFEKQKGDDKLWRNKLVWPKKKNK